MTTALDLSEDERMFRDMVRDFARSEIAPIAAEIDETSRFPAETLVKMAPLGLLGIPVPEEYGGAGANLLREQAAESLTLAQQASEMITLLGDYPSLTIGPLLGSHKHDIHAIMRESLDHKAKARGLELLQCAERHSVITEECARRMSTRNNYMSARSKK